MPVSPIVPNTVEVRLLWIFSLNGAVNVLHATVPSGFAVTQAIVNTLGAAIKSAWTTNLGAFCASDTSLVRVGLRDLRTANQSEVLDVGAAVAGTDVADSLPPQTAACVTLKTAKAGKSFRGRVYLGGFSELRNQAGGVMTGSVNTGIVSFMTAVSGAMTASGMTLAVASRGAEHVTVVRTTFHADGSSTLKTVSNTPARDAQSNVVTLIQSRNQAWETQRRRNNGRGATPTFAGAVAEQTIGH